MVAISTIGFDNIHVASTRELLKKGYFYPGPHIHTHTMSTSCYYTELQKKLITSSGRRSLKSTLSKLITFGHR